MISPIREGHSLVLTGAWNYRLFSPVWVTQFLAPGAEIGVAVGVSSLNLPLRLIFQGLELTVTNTRLVLQVEQLGDDSLQAAQATALRILELLPHTPVQGAGINVQFVENEPAPELLGVFDLPDRDGLLEAGGTVRSTSIRRTIALPDGLTLNLALELKPNGHVAFDFNFHSETASAAAAATHLNRGFVAMRDESLRILDAAYSLGPVHH